MNFSCDIAQEKVSSVWPLQRHRNETDTTSSEDLAKKQEISRIDNSNQRRKVLRHENPDRLQLVESERDVH